MAEAGSSPLERASWRLRKADELARKYSESGVVCRVSRHLPSVLSAREYVVKLGIPYESFVEQPLEVGDYVAAVNALNLQLVLLRVEEVSRRSVDAYLSGEPPIAGEDVRSVNPASLLTPVEVSARPIAAFDYDEASGRFLEYPRGVALPIEPQSPVFRPRQEFLVKLLGLPEEGCTLGCMVTEGLKPLLGVAVKLPLKAFYQHVLITGTTGSGKTTLVKNMVASIAAKPEATVVILDVTGEYVQIVCDKPEWRVPLLLEEEGVRRSVYEGVGPLKELVVLLPLTREAVARYSKLRAEEVAMEIAEDYFEMSLRPLGAELVEEPEPRVEGEVLEEIKLVVETRGGHRASLSVRPWALELSEVGPSIADLSPILTLQARGMLKALISGYLNEFGEARLDVFLEELRISADLYSRLNLLRSGRSIEEKIMKVLNEYRLSRGPPPPRVEWLLRKHYELSIHRSTLENMLRALGALERTGLFDVREAGFRIVEQPYSTLLEESGVVVVDIQAYVRGRDSERVVVYRVLERLFSHKLKAYLERRPTRPLIVVVDEAHQYFPAFTARGEEESYWIIESMLTRIARLGRRHGMGLVFATHSPQDLNPVVVQLSNTKIVLRSERRVLEALGVPLEYRRVLEIAPDRVGLVRSHFYRTHYALFKTAPPLVGHMDLSSRV